MKYTVVYKHTRLKTGKAEVKIFTNLYPYQVKRRLNKATKTKLRWIDWLIVFPRLKITI